MKKRLPISIIALGIMTCGAQMEPMDFANKMIELNKTTRDGENPWDWCQRNDLREIPLDNSVEFEPDRPLIATHPFFVPQPGVRAYRRGVFVLD